MAAELCRHVLARNGRMWAKFLMDCSFSAKLSRKGVNPRSVQDITSRRIFSTSVCRTSTSSRSFCSSAVQSTEDQHIHQQPRILTAVCLERLPRITPNKTELEKRFELLQEQLELEHSVLSDEEIEIKKLNQRKKKTSDDDDDGLMEIAKLEAERKEFDEEEEEEQKKFQPASRETEADQMNNVKSLERRLHNTLVLVVKREKSEGGWELPQGQISEGETLRQAAEKMLSKSCGSALVARFLTNMPAAVFKDSKGSSSETNKVFIYKAQYVSGDLAFSEEFCDHAWVSREELKEYISPEYNVLIRKIIY